MNYFYQDKQGQSVGPVSAGELIRLRELNVVSDASFVCMQGTRQWIAYNRAGLHASLPSVPLGNAPAQYQPLPPDQGIRMNAPGPMSGGVTAYCPNCQQNVGTIYDLNGWAIVYFILGVLIPLWLISLPLFWWLAYSNRHGQRRCGICRTPT
jgi:hypothetical protein